MPVKLRKVWTKNSSPIFQPYGKSKSVNGDFQESDVGNAARNGTETITKWPNRTWYYVEPLPLTPGVTKSHNENISEFGKVHALNDGGSFQTQQPVDEQHALNEHLRQENAKLSSQREEINGECIRLRERLIHNDAEQQQTILELQQSVGETRALNEQLQQENTILSSELDQVKADFTLEKESLIRSNAEKKQTILELQQSVDESHAFREHLQRQNAKLSSQQEETNADLTREKESLIQSNAEKQQKILELQQSVDASHALREHLQQENQKLSNQQEEMEQECIREKESLLQTNAEKQQKILELQKSVDEQNALRVTMKEVETRLEERSAQNVKLENENIRLRGELSDMMQGLLCSARTSSSESDAFLSPWEVISSDGASTQTTKAAKGHKKIRRSLKNRKSQPTAESFSIPETAGEYQD